MIMWMRRQQSKECMYHHVQAPQEHASWLVFKQVTGAAQALSTVEVDKKASLWRACACLNS